jgi:hypothetical protein
MHTPVFLIAQSFVSKQADTLNVILVAKSQAACPALPLGAINRPLRTGHRFARPSAALGHQYQCEDEPFSVSGNTS